MSSDTQTGSTPAPPEYLIVGQIVAPHALKGELKVNILTEFPERVAKLEQVILAPYTYFAPKDIPGATLNPATLRPSRSSVRAGEAAPSKGARPPGAPTPFHIESAHSHKGQILLKLEGVDNADAAEALRGYWLMVPIEQAKKLSRGAYYLYQIVGLDVYTTAGKRIGKVEDVLTGAANDVYVVRGPGVKDPTGELLVPAIKPVVKRMELKRGRIVIAPPEEWA